ncbi:MAG: ABC transporter permease [Lautropia sp.]
MATLIRLALASAWNRRLTLLLTMLSIALAVFMLLGVDRLREAARTSFTEAASGTDLIVGARTSPLQLLLYSVFRMGEATSDFRWSSFEKVRARDEVAWAIPLALGDSHRGFSVLGTSAAYFEHFRYGDARSLRLAEGRPFTDLFEAVLGADVARALAYRLDDAITLSHGAGGIGGPEHADKPFRVVGILARTGTPVDRSVHVSLESIEAIHLDWQAGAPIPGLRITPAQVRKFDLAPKRITAALVGLHSRGGVFRVQRAVNLDEEEALMAILPGVALDQLWGMMDIAERAMIAIGWFVVAAGLAGMVSTVLAGLNERRRELSILRSVGAGPGDVVALVALEGFFLTAAGILAGYLLLLVAIAVAGPVIDARFGVAVPLIGATASQGWLLLGVLAVGTLASLIPAWRANRLSLQDGLVARV